MAFEHVSLAVAGRVFQPITIQVVVALDQAARSFSAKLKTRETSQAELLTLLRNSPPCTVKARQTENSDTQFQPGAGDLMLTGHLEKRSPRLAGEEKELTVSGRSKTGDLVDSTHGHKTGEFLKKTQKQILDDLTGEFGVKVESDLEHKPREVVRLRPDETVFKVAERLARAEGNSITDTPDGNLKLVRGAKKRHVGYITDGDGWPVIVDASAEHDDSKRSKDVKVRAQAPDGYSPPSLQIEEGATDEGVKRLRRRVIVPPEQISKDEARQRAKWHRDRAAGKGISCEVTVKGWRDAPRGGNLWTPGWLVYVEIRDLDLAQDMLIERVAFDQSDADSGGTRAALTLVDPRAYGGKSGKGAKSGPQWNLGKAGADDV